jgi:hypothetical protein
LISLAKVDTAETQRKQWRWAAFATLAVTLLAIYPQINLWMARNKEWSGSYVLVQGDEIAYSAYINALIDGRPRRNDPFVGKDDVPGAPIPESLFSIQVVPAYAIALPARLLHISASTAFIFLIVICAIGASLAIFWLLRTITGDDRIAATGVLVTLCLGTLAAGQGEARVMLLGQNVYDFFPYLRRYQPSVAFPLLFIFFALVWRALTSEGSKAAIRHAVLAGLIFVVLAFSYFYLWTAALAWLACLVISWVVVRKQDWQRVALTTVVVGAFAVPAIAFFFILLSHRSRSMDSTQLLSLSHAPDLSYAPELVALAVLAALLYSVWRKTIDMKDPKVVFAASLALMPIVVFNQQVVTGRSLQPIHYQVFIANYVVLAAAVLAASAIWRGRREARRHVPGKVLIYVCLMALAWGIVELAGSTRRNAAYARIRDDSMVPITRLADIARQDGTYDRARLNGSYPIVYSTNLMVAGNLATAAPQGVLWAQHTPAAGVVGLEQSKELYYFYLYYSGADENELAKAMVEGRFNTLSALFGVERVITTLTPDAKPITPEDMRAEIRRYSDFIHSFSRKQAAQPLLSYVVAPVQAEPNYANLDRWYERDAGERIGIYVIYRVKLRP